MGSKSNNWFLNSLTSPKGNVGDFRHAARLFDDDDIRLAPKFKFQYHVKFNINPKALNTLNFSNRHQQEFDMLVKTAELPKFNVQVETLNQYNRKKITHVKIDYQPINITFHEDNFNVVRMLWESYYSYYFADNDAAKVIGNYQRTAMLHGNNVMTPYGFDNGSHVPFFTDVTLYLMARKSFNSVKLINPVITSWNHDTMSHSDSGTAQNSMQLAYEAVSYDYGQVQRNNPPSFAADHYDHVPSPLSLAGGGTRTVFGSGGVLAGISTVFGNVASGKAFESPANFLTTAIQTINTMQNAKTLTKAGIKNEFQNIAVRGLQAAATTTTGIINSTRFPVAERTNNVTTTTPGMPGGGP